MGCIQMQKLLNERGETMKINQNKKIEIEAKVLSIHIKVRDEFAAQLLNDKDEVLRDYEGYVPEFMPGDHFGDYLMLDIDIDTGKILNWKVPNQDQLEMFLKEDDDD